LFVGQGPTPGGFEASMTLAIAKVLPEPVDAEQNLVLVASFDAMQSWAMGGTG